MSGPIQGLIVPVTARLKIESATYELATFDITYMVNGPATAQCNLSVGFKGDNSGQTGVQLLAHTRGSAASIEMTVETDVVDPVSGTLLLKAGTHQAFTGVLDDQGPGNLAMGSFNIRVSLVSKLAILATGSLQLSHLICSSYLDTSIPISMIAHGASAEISPGGGGYNPADMTDDFWKATQKVFRQIATEGTTGGTTRKAIQEYKNKFGNDTNAEALKIIDQLTGSLVFGEFQIPVVVSALSDHLNVLFTTNFKIESFYNRIVSLGQEFKFRIIEDFAGMRVVPYSPFFPATDAIPIYPSTVSDMNWANREPNSVLGCAMITSGPTVIDSDQKEEPSLVGAYKRPVDASKSPLGAILAIPSPPWMAAKRYDKDNRSYWFSVPFDIVTKIGDLYCKEQTLELAYRGYGVQVRCPLRTDIGLCSPVQVLYPKLPGTNLGPSIYGSVQMVKLCMDAVQKQAYTIMEIGYARSDRLQEQELNDYSHPVWADQYRGGRLDTAG